MFWKILFYWPNFVDPDPHSINADPHHWFNSSKSYFFSAFLRRAQTRETQKHVFRWDPRNLISVLYLATSPDIKILKSYISGYQKHPQCYVIVVVEYNGQKVNIVARWCLYRSFCWHNKYLFWPLPLARKTPAPKTHQKTWTPT